MPDEEIIYRIVNDPQYDALRLRLRVDPVSLETAHALGAGVQELGESENAELGRNIGGCEA